MAKKRDFKWVNKDNIFVKVPLNGEDAAAAKKIEVAPEKKPVAVAIQQVIKGNAGVYVIVCEREKCVYVGQSMNVPVRLRSHKLYLMGGGKNVPKTYTKMIDHYTSYGIEAFEFRLHLKCEAAASYLLEMETATMREFHNMGYMLYNRNAGVLSGDEIIKCPKEYRGMIKLIIDKMVDDGVFLEKVRKLSIS
jgi:hypothetical protein